MVSWPDLIKRRLEWLFVLLISFKLTFLTVFQGFALDTYTPSELLYVLITNGVPFFFLYVFLRNLLDAKYLLLTCSLAISLLCFSAVAKGEMLAQPLIFPDIFELGNAIGVRAAVWSELPKKYYLVLSDTICLLALWRTIKIQNSNFLSLIKGGLSRSGYWAPLSTKSAVAAIALMPVIFYAFVFRQQAVEPWPWLLNETEAVAPYQATEVRYKYMGVFNYFATSAMEYVYKDKLLKELAPSQGQVQEGLVRLKAGRAPFRTNSTYLGRKRPNVIIVLVESLGRRSMDSPVVMESGIDVVPFVKSLRGELFYSKKIFSPVVGGLTVEPELMMLNSLIPQTDKGIAFSKFMDREYLSLPRILEAYGYVNVAYHGNDKNFWHRIDAYRKLGFHRFESEEYFDSQNPIHLGVSDHEFLPQVAEKLKKLPQPFFALVVTLSGHRPYVIPRELQSGITDKMGNLEPLVRDYLETMNYSDRTLRDFWEMTGDLRQNSIVVVVGDHGPSFDRKSDLSLGYSDKEEAGVQTFQVPLAISAPFMEASFPKTSGVYGDLSDIAPTILQMLEIPQPKCFIGNSLFSENLTGTRAFQGKVVSIYDNGSSRHFVLGRGECKNGKDELPPENCADLRSLAESEDIISKDIIFGKRLSYRK